ncbi:hypothetical protein CDD81_910 [Ophiocordyceps australis]|uniref:PXA domain-containing protein n=1 Tax=Ophiocordyceps australis TaxID=1399860 RepID=A0A2C5YF97_9HYPO|nr:hypothetical protein CDD81_910 [Ophiocordyceps australis]
MALKRLQVASATLAALVACVCALSRFSVLRWAVYAFAGGIASTLVGLVAILLLTSKRPPNSSLSPTSGGVLFLEPRRWRAEANALRRRQAYQREPLQLGDSTRVAQAVDNLLDLVLRDFVTSWYSHISPSPVFPNEVDRTVRLALANLLEPLRHKDLAELLTSRLVPILTLHFREFNQAERSVRGRKLNRSVTESEELDLAIASKYKDGRLHPAASLSMPDTKMAQQDHLRALVARVLPRVLPSNMVSSRVVATLVREIVSCAVLFPVAQLLSDPDTWNQLVESYGRSMLQDRSTVRKLRAALDQHASPTPRSLQKTIVAPRLAPGDSERKFEKFIRGIRKVNNLSDARRFRNEVSSQLKRDSAQDDRQQQDAVYLRRLEIGKRLLDQRVEQLAAGGDQRIAARRPLLPIGASTSRLENVSLVELLRDSSGLSYFMEYMDRQNLMSLVQFWLVVDGFRVPLEEDWPEDEQEHDNLGAQSSSSLCAWTESDRADLQQIHQAYLSKPELKIPESSRATVRAFLKAGDSATPVEYHNARRAILRAQSAVLQEMQSRYYQAFRKSDLYYKCLASQDSTKSNSALPVSIPPNHGLEDHSRPMLRSHQSFQIKPKLVARLATPVVQDSSPVVPRPGSATDLRALNSNGSNGLGFLAPMRRSLDESPPSTLFDDDDDDMDPDNMLDSTHSLCQQQQQEQAPDSRVVQAVEQALNNILDDDRRPRTAEDLRASLFGSAEDDSSFLSGHDNDSNRGSLDGGRSSTTGGKELEKPSLSSLGLVSAASRIGVFVDNDLFDDEERYLPDVAEEDGDDLGASNNEDGDDDKDQIHEAAPGDLGLAEAITALTNDIDRLVTQEAVIDSLTRKAELTNNTSELRILRKSKASLQREIRRKELQRQQYVIQESDNSLYGRSNVRIKSIQVGREDDGKEYALYVVEVQRNAGEQMPAASWIVTRRYSEFHNLHQQLRSRYASVRNLDFPRRRMVMKFQSEFLRKRRTALEMYLRELLLLPEACRSRELRAFLSQSAIAQGQDLLDREDKKDMMTRFYDSVADGMDDILGSIPVLDQISVAGQNLIAAATSQLNPVTIPLGANEETYPAAEAEAELNAFESKELEPFIKPICDIFLEVFELNRGNNWLRGRAVVVVLQQLLGGTIERKVRDNVRTLVQEESMLRCLDMVMGSLWPGGQLQRNRKPRSGTERNKTRTEASLMLATLVPDLAGSVVGRVNAQAASRRIFATFNNVRLNAHLVFTMLDEIVSILFDEP